MKFEARKFSQRSYNENDRFAKEVVKDFLSTLDWVKEVIDVEDYFVDLEVIDTDNQCHYFEAEVKSGYPFTGAHDFKFDSVSFLGRKKKWAKHGFHYCIVSRETESICLAHSKDIYKEEFKEIRKINKRDRSGLDAFYRVPKGECKWYSKVEGLWKKIT